MIELLFALILLVGWILLGIGTVRSLSTGRLEPFSSWLEVAGARPILRDHQPVRFWTAWLALVWVVWVPLAALAYALLVGSLSGRVG
jgi:hypothetical protein